MGFLLCRVLGVSGLGFRVWGLEFGALKVLEGFRGGANLL